jgi:hypothetical protein
MKEIKEIVDKYLKQHFDTISNLRTTKNFKWETVSAQIAPNLNPEYVRSRFRKISTKRIEPTALAFTTSGKGVIPYNSLSDTFKKTIGKIENTINYISGKEDKKQGTKEFTFTADKIPTEQEIIKHFNIDTTKWFISQIYHKTSFGGKYAITVNQRAKVGNQTINIDEDFLESIKQIKPLATISNIVVNNKEKACLLIPKQDAHWDKRDVDGNNNIEERFETFTKSLLSQLEKIQLTNSLEKIIYIVGSDEFNSEWTGTTTKGTPQSNIVSYQEGFKRISNYTIELIKLLRLYTPKVEVILLNGNHDHNVSWHLAHLLEQIFSKNESITIDSDLKNTKILEYSSNLILMNHGDEMKPKDLATKFPIIAKDKWSSFDNYFVISGDKHHELAHDFNGVRTFQVPQLSTAKSAWDDKKGHLCSKAELVTFLFEKDGLSNILRKPIK